MGVEMIVKGLLVLAERCESAAGPDRELDAEIAVAIGYERDGDELWFKGEFYSLREPDFYDLQGKNRELRFFTASLDAAMTLAKGLGGSMTFFKDGTAKAFFWQPYPLAIEAKAATLPLAIIAAALRARAALKEPTS